MDEKTMQTTIEQFLSICQSASNEAYQQFKQLLEQLDDPLRRKAARQFLTRLRIFNRSEQSDDSSPNVHFQFLEQVVLDINDQKRNLTLLQFPSTFEPEVWSFTFYEGLIRYPATEYRDLTLLELGCGIGWISIALALRYLPKKMVGLDINPKAVTCARLNLYLNALDDEGELVTEGVEKVSLLDLVEFETSDLCDHFAAKGDYFDRIIGCIPQVLNPEPEIMDNLVAESASDEYLQSLSNYAVQQGYIEDQFGLGLIARAVEQAIALIKSNGKLILNLGGRPGRSVLENLMKRRGFTVRRVWQTQVKQAADTDIEALVAIEKSTGHRFEFYMSAQAVTPIDARTALAYLQRQGVIYHSVDVYEAQMCFPEQVKYIYREIERVSSERLRSAVDLTFDNVEDAEERYTFLSFIAGWLEKQQGFSYENTQGVLYFRQQLVEYLHYYHKVQYNENQVLITPGRGELLTNLFNSYRPKLTLIDKELRFLVDKGLDRAECEIIELPAKIQYLIELIEKLQPQLVVTQLNKDEIHSVVLVKALVDCAKDNKVTLVIDLSQTLELSSDPQSHGVYQYLSAYGHPPNVLVISALINNRVYDHYSLNITLLTDEAVQQALVDAAELTYSRTPVLVQLYYAHLLEELLYFQRTRLYVEPPSGVEKNVFDSTLTLSAKARKAMAYPAIIGSHMPFTEQTIRLDYGENEMPAPAFLKDVVFESYLVRHFNQDEAPAAQPIRELLQSRFGLPQSIYAKMLFANGVASLFSGLLQLCHEANKSMIIPSGSYGNFNAATAWQGLDVQTLQTYEQDDFKITAGALKALLVKKPGSWVYLNAPVVNPTGAIYSQPQLIALLDIAVAYDATVVFDCIFTGLEYAKSVSWQLTKSMEKFASSPTARFILISGLSKEYAAGGLRFGYAWSSSSQLMAKLAQVIKRTPHFTLGYAARELFEAHNQGQAKLVEHLDSQREVLGLRAAQLSELLNRKGWVVLPPKGGLFLVAKPQKAIDKSELDAQTVADNVAQQLFEQINVAINNSTWTGLSGYCRFVLSIKAADFTEALARFELFEL
ncbi:MAG: methionine S-methyltransferase [Alteromonadaceae bacterium]